jgi:tetratricopeptide (TPR) repeat protein
LAFRSLLVAALSLWTLPAVAEPQTAEEWNARGVQLRKELKPEQALDAFRKAHELAPSPKSHGQLGFVQHDLEQYVSAEQHLTESLAAHTDPWVVKNRKFLEEALALVGRHLGKVVVNGPAGATVRVEGVPVGTLPLARPLSLREGETLIAVSAPGFLTWEQRLTITGGSTSEVWADLIPDRGDLPGVEQPGASASELTRPIASLPAPAEGGQSGSKWRSGAGWTLVAVGVVLAGTAVWARATREPDCGSGMGACNQLPRPSWHAVVLAGASLAVVGGGVTLLAW